MVTWHDDPPPQPRVGLLGWLLVAVRAPLLLVLNFGGLALLVALRQPERLIWGLHRPLTPWITQGVCRGSLAILGIRLRITGRPMRQHGALVANHAGWLDIYTLNACDRIYFISKAEVARWPGIGWLARATGTLFITRDPREARAQQDLLEHRLRAGHRLLFFPEGTSTDGRRVLPFKTTLFAAFFLDGLAEETAIQPLSVVYAAPRGQDPRFLGWWGDMDFGPHLLKLMANPRPARAEVTFHAPIPVAEAGSRKVLAAQAEAAVRAPVDRATGPAPR
ncbi:lysophospholipid acyltransferase family protein [Frigidibacter sp. MR17.14]|uniref:lysophospholipid acyltransferase family protein n=1 Tax=Frigidibacter sp. MR17.14 TaxID=3126509 RepID=UPI003012A0BB